MRFREYLAEVKDEDLSYVESFIREEFPKGSKIRYNNSKVDSVYITWGKINPSRIPKHGMLAKAKGGSVFIDGQKVVDKKESGYDFNKLLSKLNKKLKYNNADSIKKIGISFDESDTIDGQMRNGVFYMGEY
jgi:hypothetical protein